MFKKRDYNKISFMGVALALILFGAFICGFALAAWILRFFGVFVGALPFFKVIGGLVILALGYIILEIELLRKK